MSTWTASFRGLLCCFGVVLVGAPCSEQVATAVVTLDSRAHTGSQHSKLYTWDTPAGRVLMNAAGKIVLSPPLLSSAIPSGNGAWMVELSHGRSAHISPEGQILKELPYEVDEWFSEGLAEFTMPVDGLRRRGYIDQDYRVRIPPKFITVLPFHEHLAGAREEVNGKFGFIDTDGHWKIPPQFDMVGSFGNGLAPIDLCGHCSYINRSGQRAFPVTFQFCWEFADGVAKVQFDEKSWGFIDTAGRAVATLKGHMPNVDGISEGLIEAADKDRSKLGFVDVKGNWVVPPTFDAVQPFNEGLAAVRKDDHWGYIDHSDQLVIPPRFCDNMGYTGDFQEGLAFVCDPKIEKFGFIDRTGRYAIPPRFIMDQQVGCPQNKPCGFDGELAYVATETRFGYINKQGRFVYSEPIHQEADPPARRHGPGKKTVR